MKKKLFFLCALCALLALALPALGERVELLDGRITVELPEGGRFRRAGERDGGAGGEVWHEQRRHGSIYGGKRFMAGLDRR